MTQLFRLTRYSFWIGFLLVTLCTFVIAQRSSELHYYFPPPKDSKPESIDVDICVYGGTSGGLAAAIQASRSGKSVVVLEPSGHFGGMTTGGLSYTDYGRKEAVGGIAREFYRRIGKHYGLAEEWQFEPHVAEETFAKMLQEANIQVFLKQYLHTVKHLDRRIFSITTEAGITVIAKVFIDVTYEGDLLANSGTKYTVGRESSKEYGESLNGSQVMQGHQFDRHIDPYVVPGDASSGTLPTIDPELLPPAGTGDNRVQAYNFRLCMTTHEPNHIPIEQPRGYDRKQYELLARLLKSGFTDVFGKFDAIQNNKIDKNNSGPVSTDFIGQNYGFPNGSYQARERIFQRHVTYEQGLFWFLAHDPAVPEHIRERRLRYGLCKDEFKDTGGWPSQLYIREARRMVSGYVMTQQNCEGERVANDSVGLGVYNMDSHNCRRAIKDGHVVNEGDVQVSTPPYPISYRAIVPKMEECQNLIVPVCLSSSHIAYGSIRMEPVFMVLGQSAALAADIAIAKDISVQEVPYAELRELLVKAGQILSLKSRKVIK